MPPYPKKVLNPRHYQSNAADSHAGHIFEIVEAALGSPVVDDVNRLVTSIHAAVGAYTIDGAQPDVPRNITVTWTADGNPDTEGTLIVVGTDRADQVITETLTPATGTTVAGTMAFKTVTSLTGVGWVIDQANDTIEIGVGGLIGLPDKLTAAHPIQGWLNGSVEAVLPAMTVSATVLALNTVDFTTAWGGTVASVIYLK